MRSPPLDAGLWLVKEWLVPPLSHVHSFASRKRVFWGNNFTSNNDLFGSSWVTSLLGKVLSNLNSSHGNPLEATKSKTIWSLLLARKCRLRNSPLGVQIRSLLTGSAFSSFGSGGKACSKESLMAWMETICICSIGSSVLPTLCNIIFEIFLNNSYLNNSYITIG